ncbi:uncharacterized protein LOC131651621 [Vicia villosa]|uniref:uncharacterized protein LOC131651621 n=1 Tax=Vicia villosa TaxID=3911 RepID=UPI00273C3D82|nr:uncharacterized protein LOC131651621 [Vicia villosa]
MALQRARTFYASLLDRFRNAYNSDSIKVENLLLEVLLENLIACISIHVNNVETIVGLVTVTQSHSYSKSSSRKAHDTKEFCEEIWRISSKSYMSKDSQWCGLEIKFGRK